MVNFVLKNSHLSLAGDYKSADNLYCSKMIFLTEFIIVF